MAMFTAGVTPDTGEVAAMADHARQLFVGDS